MLLKAVGEVSSELRNASVASPGRTDPVNRYIIFDHQLCGKLIFSVQISLGLEPVSDTTLFRLSTPLLETRAALISDLFLSNVRQLLSQLRTKSELRARCAF